MKWLMSAATDGTTTCGGDAKIEKVQQRKKTKCNTWMWWRCKSMHEEYWKLRLSVAFRTGWACLMAGMILRHMGNMHAKWITFPVFGYVVAVTVVSESTVGQAMQNTLAIALGTIQGVGMSLAMFQLFPPAQFSNNIGASIGCITISTFIIVLPKATPTTNILHKQIMLAHSAIIYITALVQGAQMDKVFFPLQLASTTIVGATCGMLAVVLPFPHLAMFQVQSQTKLSAKISSEQLRVLIDAFSATDIRQASAFNLQAKALTKIASAVQSSITTLEDAMEWETKHFPSHTSHNLQHMTRGLTPFQKALAGLELALQADLASLALPSKQRRLIGHNMRKSLIYVADWVCLALQHASIEIRQRSQPANHALRQVIIEEGNEVLSSFNAALYNTYQQVGYLLTTEESQHHTYNMYHVCGNAISHSMGNAYEKNHDASMYECIPHLDHVDHDGDYAWSDSEMVDTICNAAREQLEYRIASGEIGHGDGSAVLGDIPINHGFHSAYGSHLSTSTNGHMHEPGCDGLHWGSSLLPLTMGALLGFRDQAPALFFLFNVKNLVQGTQYMLESLIPKASQEVLEQLQVNRNQELAPRSDPENPHCQPASHIEVLIAGPDSSHFCRTSQTNLQTATNHVETPPRDTASAQNVPSSQNCPVQRLCIKCIARSSSAESQVKGENKPSLLLAGFKFFKPHPQQLKTAFKMSLAMAIGGILGFWFNNKKGYWADITLALGFTGATKGGSFKVAVVRTLGTISGSIYGLLVVLATSNFPVLRLVALIPWVVFTSFLRQSKIFGYAGAVSAFTGAIVILARTNKDSSDQEFTVIRIVEAFLGMASFIIVEMLVLPQRAASMVKPNIIAGLGKLQGFVSTIFEVYSSEHCAVCGRSKAIADLKLMEKKIRKAITSQNELVKEAAEEPQFWYLPFPEKVFSKVIKEQGKIMQMLHFCITVLEEIKQVAEDTKVPFDKLLQTPLKEAMIIMEEKVVPTLTFLTKVLAVEAGQVVPVQDGSQTSTASKLGAPNKSATDQGHNIDQSYKFVELEILMKSKSTARNSSVFGHHQFADEGVEEDRGFTDAFSKGVIQVAYELKMLDATSPASGCHQIGSSATSATSSIQCFDTLSNTLFLPLGTLAFAMNGLLHHTIKLEKVIHELLQEEKPWSLIDFSNTSRPKGHL